MSQIQTAVPADETPAGECEYCGQPFPTGKRLSLHKGVRHPDRLDESERKAFASTFSAEGDSLRRLRLKMLGVLILLYFAFLMVYAVFA
ncbi:DNA-binding protein [Halomicroarcula limicola]|uniref:DNA-binding protein n=1 Tax=Haloarcula limicola TaxID=1429915 RepID=A0A8J7YGE1_9EURY|nr:DNA-binding protein [Halomicroarcula limicola]MBV0926003.1 DNA-binding protein [Halomicroarcula limicola]